VAAVVDTTEIDGATAVATNRTLPPTARGTLVG